MRTHCDKCKSKIIDEKCSCGDWINSSDQPNELKVFEDAMIQFSKMKSPIISMDHHNTGTCAIYFKGSHEEVQQLKSYAYKLKKEC